jgi:hypothetical protein
MDSMVITAEEAGTIGATEGRITGDTRIDEEMRTTETSVVSEAGVAVERDTITRKTTVITAGAIESRGTRLITGQTQGILTQMITEA